ncbi:MAG: helix-turn-helix domain-containing protein [Parachlamydiales bacterium]
MKRLFHRYNGNYVNKLVNLVTYIFKRPIFTDIAAKYGVLYMDASQIAAIIRFHRKKGGLTQIELGNLAGIGKTVVFDIEKGKLTVRLSSLLKVMHVLNIKMEFQSQLMLLFKEKLNEKS